MRLSAYVMLLFSISLVFYMMGNQPIMLKMFDSQGNSTLGTTPVSPEEVRDGDPPLDGDGTSILGLILLALGGLTVLGIITGQIGGFAAIYIIPFILLFMLMNFFVFPLDFIMAEDVPEFIKYPIAVFFNLLLILAVLSFIRGGA